MTGALRWMLALMLAFGLALGLSGAAMGHGEEKHGGTADPAPAAAPAPSAAPVPDDAAPGATEETSDHDQASRSAGAATVLKNLHPATVHFPIALLLVGALAEALAMARGSQVLAGAARVMAVTGGLGAFVAAVFGWIHTGIWLGGEGTMQVHRWTGTAVGAAGLVIAWLGWRGGSRTALRLLLFAAAIAVAVQGYLGAELSQGAGHLFQN